MLPLLEGVRLVGLAKSPAATGAPGAIVGTAPRATWVSARLATLAASGAVAEPGERPKATGIGATWARGPSETRPELERLNIAPVAAGCAPAIGKRSEVPSALPPTA